MHRGYSSPADLTSARSRLVALAPAAAVSVVSKDLWDVIAAARAADVPLPVAGLLAQVLAARVEAAARRQ